VGGGLGKSEGCVFSSRNLSIYLSIYPSSNPRLLLYSSYRPYPLYYLPLVPSTPTSRCPPTAAAERVQQLQRSAQPWA